jgi:hypothetical protein
VLAESENLLKLGTLGTLLFSPRCCVGSRNLPYSGKKKKNQNTFFSYCMYSILTNSHSTVCQILGGRGRFPTNKQASNSAAGSPEAARRVFSSSTQCDIVPAEIVIPHRLRASSPIPPHFRWSSGIFDLLAIS